MSHKMSLCSLQSPKASSGALGKILVGTPEKKASPLFNILCYDVMLLRADMIFQK